MFVVQNRLPVAEGREAEFEEVFERRTQVVSQQPGFDRLQLLRATETRSYIIQAYWETREAFEQWRSSEAFERAHENIPDDMFDGPNDLRLFDVVSEMPAGAGE